MAQKEASEKGSQIMEKSPVREKRLYWKLFWATFQLSAFTFGGGYVIVPLMRRKFVMNLHWLEDDEMLDLTAIAQSTPGAMAVNASVLVGYRVAGVPGAFITVLATILPPFLILSVISLFYTQFRDNWAVNLVLKGMQAGVAAVICDVVVSMGWNIFKLRRILPVIMMAGAFVASWFFGINVVLVILACAVVGAVDTWRREREAKKEGKKL